MTAENRLPRLRNTCERVNRVARDGWRECNSVSNIEQYRRVGLFGITQSRFSANQVKAQMTFPPLLEKKKFFFLKFETCRIKSALTSNQLRKNKKKNLYDCQTCQKIEETNSKLWKIRFCNDSHQVLAVISLLFWKPTWRRCWRGEGVNAMVVLKNSFH